MDCIVMNTETGIYFVSNDVTTMYVEDLITSDEIDNDTTIGKVLQSDYILLEMIAEHKTFTTSTSMHERNKYIFKRMQINGGIIIV